MKAVRGLRVLALAAIAALVTGGTLAVASAASAAPTTWDLSVTVTSTDLPSVEGVPVYVSQELTTTAGQVFLPPTFQGLTGPGGVIDFPAVPEGVYFVVADAGDGWVQASDFMPLFSDDSLSLDIVPGVVLSGTIRDGVTGADLPDKTVRACGFSTPGAFGSGCYFDMLNVYADITNTIIDPLTAPGVATYKFTVPFDDDYELSAYDPLGVYADQNWDHRSGCGCASDLIEVDPTGTVNHAAPYDFDLFPDDTTITWDLYLEDPATNPIDAVTSRLMYHGASGLVQADAYETDPSGYVELFGTTAGDYALTFAINGSFYPIVSYDIGGGPVTVNTCQLEFPGVVITDSFLVTVVVDNTGHPCGYAPPSSPAPTTKKPTRFGSSVIASLITPTPTPTPTPTSTPTPSSSPSSSPSPTPSVTPEPVPGDPGFPWWIILIIVIAIGIVILVVVLVRRR